VIAECSGLRSGWLKGRKGSVEGWFPEDFVMPVLSESSEPLGHRHERSDDNLPQTEAEYSNISTCQYSNVPETTQYVIL